MLAAAGAKAPVQMMTLTRQQFAAAQRDTHLSHTKALNTSVNKCVFTTALDGSGAEHMKRHGADEATSNALAARPHCHGTGKYNGLATPTDISISDVLRAAKRTAPVCQAMCAGEARTNDRAYLQRALVVATIAEQITLAQHIDNAIYSLFGHRVRAVVLLLQLWAIGCWGFLLRYLRRRSASCHAPATAERLLVRQLSTSHAVGVHASRPQRA